MSLTAQLDAPPFRTDEQGVVRIGQTRCDESANPGIARALRAYGIDLVKAV
jgi:hypothetical protein